jgi:hypothetical protein
MTTSEPALTIYWRGQPLDGMTHSVALTDLNPVLIRKAMSIVADEIILLLEERLPSHVKPTLKP